MERTLSKPVPLGNAAKNNADAPALLGALKHKSGILVIEATAHLYQARSTHEHRRVQALQEKTGSGDIYG
jgi:Tfp pilus assembly protein PilO